MYIFEAGEVAKQLVAAMKRVLEKLKRANRTVHDQAVRSTLSVHLNLEEGARRGGRDRTNHYRMAAGSAAELRATLQAAVTWEFLTDEEVKLPLALIDRECAMLWRLTHSASTRTGAPAPGR
jgi:four helix bundle protein